MCREGPRLSPGHLANKQLRWVQTEADRWALGYTLQWPGFVKVLVEYPLSHLSISPMRVGVVSLLFIMTAHSI